MALGVVVPNPAVSRRAMQVAATEHGWEITVPNRNGAILHPWGLPSQRASVRGNLIDWPLVAVRMLPSSGFCQHWVLLEFDGPSLLPDVDNTRLFPEIDDCATVITAVTRPGRLTNAEREALHMVFKGQLQWPPTEHACPMLLKQAAARLHISVSGLQDRLKSALARAIALGHDRTVPLTDPSYLYVLVRAGYLDLPTQFPHRYPGPRRLTELGPIPTRHAIGMGEWSANSGEAIERAM
jgi:hypothetical protein